MYSVCNLLNSMHLVLLAFKSSWRPRKECCMALQLVWRFVNYCNTVSKEGQMNTAAQYCLVLTVAAFQSLGISDNTKERLNKLVIAVATICLAQSCWKENWQWNGAVWGTCQYSVRELMDYLSKREGTADTFWQDKELLWKLSQTDIRDFSETCRGSHNDKNSRGHDDSCTEPRG